MRRYRSSHDPCPSPPLTRAALQALGVWWLDEPENTVFLTRLHARYDRASFPEDLVLQTTADQQNFQARVVVRNEWTGESRCENANAYRKSLPDRRARDAATLAKLTGWSLDSIRGRMGLTTAWLAPGEPRAAYRSTAWWESLWK